MRDGKLVEKYRAGDKNAWNILCKQHGRKLFSFFLRSVRNREDARDLSQDTLIEAMITLPKLKNPESFRGWLYEIARGCLAKFFKGRNSRGIHEPFDETSHDGMAKTTAAYAVPAYQQPEERVIAKECLEIVHSLVERLPKSEREVFRLKLADSDVTQKEIAETLDISVSAVKVRVHRGTKKLQKWFEAEYPGEFTYLFE